MEHAVTLCGCYNIASFGMCDRCARGENRFGAASLYLNESYGFPALCDNVDLFMTESEITLEYPVSSYEQIKRSPSLASVPRFSVFRPVILHFRFREP